ncbi:MAG: hypothetical protein KC501_08695 [Myxococcales bacterium]|nr:hypothetical protein [Myxococcales bacterium]
MDTDTVDTSVTIYDGDEGWEEGTRHRHCHALWEGAKARADEVNQRLAQRSWRKLERLPLPIHGSDLDDREEDRAAVLASPAASRFVELTHVGNDLVLRVPGVRVLVRTPVRWQGPWDYQCDTRPHLREVWADRPSGAVAVLYDHQSGACMCYPPLLTGVLRWSPETFEAIDRSPGLPAVG